MYMLASFRVQTWMKLFYFLQVPRMYGISKYPQTLSTGLELSLIRY